MAAIVMFLVLCMCLGLFATRFKGHAHLLLVVGIVAMLAYELVYLLRM
jgi:hypothetical protein